jgi:redox-sensitive bicupin YhaK (pirin superfamily)
MSAAAGVLHKEYHEREFSQKGGWYQMIQLWVNLPSKHKMEAPSYQEITNATMPLHRYEQGSELKIIAGSYLDKKSTTHTYTAINMYVLDVKKGDNCVFDLPETHNTSLLCIDGEAIINNNTTLRVDQFALMQNSGTTFEISTSDHAKLLILSGAPIDEPIVSYGPFVMNTREQISEAISDYNAGKFGVLD